jgi:hypothetical protein
MQIPNTEQISPKTALELVQQYPKEGTEVNYDSSRHQLIFENHGKWIAKIYLPFTWMWNLKSGLTERLDSHFALVMIRAGQASLGYFHQGKLIDHRVFRAYMVRQKQGKSQIKYLKTKGKSRAGSRVRLAETERFFEEINERLNFYDSQYHIDFWGVSCGKTLWPYFFSSSPPPPFTSDSNALIELPFHVGKASHEELQSAGKMVTQFHLLLPTEGRDFGGPLSNSKNQSEEDW